MAYSFCVEWPKAEVFEYEDVVHRGRKRDEMTKISASLGVFLALTLITLYGLYASMLQVNPLLDFSLYSVNIHAGMIVGTK